MYIDKIIKTNVYLLNPANKKMAKPDLYRPIASPELVLAEAEANLQKLRNNEYPGRGIVMGLDDTGNRIIQMYWLMGRSGSSRNRRFVVEEDMTVRVARVDDSVPVPSGQEDLIYYNAMRQGLGLHVVSNGSQTDDILDGTLFHGFASSLGFQDHEPDYPNFTPRISAIYSPDSFLLQENQSIGIVRPEKPNIDEEDSRDVYNYRFVHPGIGRAIHTYAGNGNPLPAFEGEPYQVPLKGSPEDILDTYWNTLNEANKVAIAVKTIDIDTGDFYLLTTGIHARGMQ